MICGVLLAAGAATRFGGSKLTTPVCGEPLVRHAARALRESKLIDDMSVVVGNDALAVREALTGINLRFVEHAQYAQGLGSSIAAGVGALPASCEAAIIALGDQPFVETAAFDALVTEWKRSAAHVVATRYRGVPANPVLFARAIFPELRALRGDAGARSIVLADETRVRWIDVDAPIPLDIDTPADVPRL